MIEIIHHTDNRLHQGDIIRDVTFIENVTNVANKLKISKVIFPLVIVLSQECDLLQNFNERCINKGEDKHLFSVLVAPLYNFEHFIDGLHLSDLDKKMQQFSRNKTKSDNRNLRYNNNPRYHYMEFKEPRIVPSVIDFKHYFGVELTSLESHRASNIVCSVASIYREAISQRFCSYLSRIGLPNANVKDNLND
ncbi:MAG TPA: hypothetical protein GXZ86_00360 [Clostridiales bacterium]|jgi:hypothetical protein|nr:hypothetical protein [Clostridiales bacterium]